jgi:multiple sugar transport system substrate-binding protein
MSERSPARLSYCYIGFENGWRFMARFQSILLLLGTLTVLSGCGGDTAVKKSDGPTFAGVTLRMSIEKGSPLSEALRLRVPEWEARTGAKVETTEDEVVNPEADVAACSGATLANLSQRRAFSNEFKKNNDVGFLHIPYLHQTAFGARNEAAVAFPLAVEQLLLWRRADLFADEKLKTAYQKEFKTPLAPPKTWDEYAQIASFFQKAKAVKFGCVEAFGDDADGLRGFFARAASFSEDPRSTPFDVSDAHSRLADPEYQKAAENLSASLANSPVAGGKPVTMQQAREIFAAGDAAMILSPVPPTSHPSLKTAPGFTDKLAVSALPSSVDVFSGKSKTWRPRQLKGQEVPSAPYFAATGYFLSVAESTKNHAAAENLIAFLGSMKDNAYLVQGARLGLTPAREEMLNDSGRFAGGYGLPGKVTADFFELVRVNLRPSRWATDLRVAYAKAFLRPLGEQLKATVAGSIAIPAALRNAHRAWQREIGRRGDAFIDEFRMSQGFSKRIK